MQSGVKDLEELEEGFDECVDELPTEARPDEDMVAMALCWLELCCRFVA
jgi:hypothetical protein